MTIFIINNQLIYLPLEASSSSATGSLLTTFLQSQKRQYHLTDPWRVPEANAREARL